MSMLCLPSILEAKPCYCRQVVVGRHDAAVAMIDDMISVVEQMTMDAKTMKNVLPVLHAAKPV